MSRTFAYFTAVVGVVCAYFIIRLSFFIDLSTRAVRSDVIQGVLIGVLRTYSRGAVSRTSNN